MILDVMEMCNNSALSLVLPVVKRILLIIQLIVPILLIIMGIIQFTNMMMNPDEKKHMKSLINKVIAAIIVFMIPVLMNTVMGVIGESTEFSKCWTTANENTTNTGHTYIETGGERTKIVTGESYDSSDSNNKKKSSKKSSSSSKSDTKIKNIIFVGDSRTVQMYAYLSGDWNGANYSSGGVNKVDKDIFIAEGSQGLSWLKSTGIPKAKNYMKSGSALVILMGVNDISNIDSYISYLKSNIKSWTDTGTKVYYVSVNPCEGSYSSHNSKINNFNSKLKNNLPNNITWIDTNSYLKSSGYSTTDGLHYDKKTSNKIYKYIKSKV